MRTREGRHFAYCSFPPLLWSPISSIQMRSAISARTARSSTRAGSPWANRVWITQPSKSPEGSQGRSGGSIGCCLVTRVRLPPRCRAGGNDRGRRFPACPQGRLHVAPPRLTVKGGALVMSSERQRPGGSKRSGGALDGESGATNPCHPLDMSLRNSSNLESEDSGYDLGGWAIPEVWSRVTTRR